LLYALKRHNLKRGLASLCLGGGNAVAMVIERILGQDTVTSGRRGFCVFDSCAGVSGQFAVLFVASLTPWGVLEVEILCRPALSGKIVAIPAV
jgi:hypothetical protein